MKIFHAGPRYSACAAQVQMTHRLEIGAGPKQGCSQVRAPWLAKSQRAVVPIAGAKRQDRCLAGRIGERQCPAMSLPGFRMFLIQIGASVRARGRSRGLRCARLTSLLGGPGDSSPRHAQAISSSFT